ncbi:MAG: MFS transporter [Chloroflexi bacterium]|nr:MFS transporter [Chloroflexota bacterium]MBI5082943.1 MFS transporter [Chloroflexota bacterium]MBI5714439.1 MFS transporter [Chloroflexota bacterium]
MNKKSRLSLPRWSVAPEDSSPLQRKNFLNVQIDGIGIGLSSAASQFLPVFLTRLGATNFQVGLLTSMPGFTGLIFSIFVGRFLQTRKKIIPWFSAARLMVVSAYAMTGVVTLLIPRDYQVAAILAIWAVVTLPQITVNVAFSVVMNAVAGPNGRYALMSRRWTILGVTTAIVATIAGQVLDRIGFPLNYQVVFIGLSAGGLISYYFSNQLVIPDNVAAAAEVKTSGLRERLAGSVSDILSERDFVRFSLQRFVFLSGNALGLPLFPIYYVREIQASDAWIGIINTAATAVVLLGYTLWVRTSQWRGSRFVLLASTFGMSLYPALMAFTHQVELVAFYAALGGFFQCGIDLVFFDELMKVVPQNRSAIFVSIAQSMQYLATILAPLIGTALASTSIGVGGALLVSAAVRFAGFLLFALWVKQKPKGS